MAVPFNNRCLTAPMARPQPARVLDDGDRRFLETVDRQVPASALNQADKNAVWREIKANHPDRVAFFEDPQVKALLAAGAVPCFPPELVLAARKNATPRKL